MPYRPGRRAIPLAEALDLLSREGRPIERTETLPLSAADGRVLAEDVTADFDVPRFRRSMMDGYAVRAADTAGATPDTPVTLRVLEFVYTGSTPSADVAPGTASGIATGAPIPDEADAVVIVEQTRREGDRVEVLAAVRPGQNISRAGSDVDRGTLALPAGTHLTPARLGVAAALGRTDLVVFARPRVAILSTGDEIVAPGRPLGPGQIYDVNSVTLAAGVRANGGEPVLAPRTRDERQALRAVFERCLAEDLVLFSGGSSVGERDLVLDVMAEFGDLIFEGILLKPGRPTVFAVLGDTPVFGMPGNPTSCLSNLYLLVAPLLRRMARLPAAARRQVTVPLASAVTSVPARHQVYPVRLADGRAEPAFKGSGDITSLAWADGYIEIEADVERVEAGTMVRVTLF